MSLSRGIPHITHNHQKLGGNIGDSESLFNQDFDNISKKIHASLARERSWRLDYIRSSRIIAFYFICAKF